MGKHTAAFVMELLQRHQGDQERTARYLRDTLKIGSIKACRAIIEQAFDTAYGKEYMRLAREGKLTSGWKNYEASRDD